jgi:hypothetical protein
VPDDHLRPDRHAIEKIDHVPIGESKASRRNGMADGFRLIGAVYAVDGGAEIKRAGTHRIPWAASHAATSGGEPAISGNRSLSCPRSNTTRDARRSSGIDARIARMHCGEQFHARTIVRRSCRTESPGGTTTHGNRAFNMSRPSRETDHQASVALESSTRALCQFAIRATTSGT